MDIKFDKFENLVSMDKINVIAIAALAYGVYRYLSPDYLDDFEDDFEDDDFEDDFEEDDFED